jgi:hypothetical protein
MRLRNSGFLGGFLRVFGAFVDFGDFFYLKLYEGTENFTENFTEAPKIQTVWRREFIPIALSIFSLFPP